jgi:hypothetical protein
MGREWDNGNVMEVYSWEKPSRNGYQCDINMDIDGYVMDNSGQI